MVALAGKVGSWGFPFGLLLPLAVIGTVWGGGFWRSFPALIVVGVQALAIVLVFSSARYRIALIPGLAVLGAAGLEMFIESVSENSVQRVSKYLFVMIVVAIVQTVPGPFAQEQDIADDLYFEVGRGYYEDKNWEEAKGFLEKSIELDPDRHASRQVYGIVLANLGDCEGAVDQFERALELIPDHAATEKNVVAARKECARKFFLAGRGLEVSDPGAAIEKYSKAVAYVGDWYKPRARLALVLSSAGDRSVRDGDAALAAIEEAERIRGIYDPYLEFIRSAALAEAGKFKLALTVLEYLASPEGGCDYTLQVRVAEARQIYSEEKALDNVPR